MEDTKESQQLPHFETPLNVPIARFQSDEVFHMQSTDPLIELSEEDFEHIAQVCNEDLIYNALFKVRLGGKEYSIEDARGFTEWAKEGWKMKNKFVFLIRNPQNQIIGAVDIKSNNLEAAEIGYWISSTTPGVMTNAIEVLCDIAKKAGYKNLYGMTVLDNQKSQNVLLRAGFIDEGLADRKGKEYVKFSKSL